MLNRWSALALVVGVLGGYAVGSGPLAAQVSGYPVNIGERVQFMDGEGRIMGTCTVAVVQGDYIGCQREGRFGRDEVTEWWRMDRVLKIQKIGER